MKFKKILIATATTTILCGLGGLNSAQATSFHEFEAGRICSEIQTKSKMMFKDSDQCPTPYVKNTDGECEATISKTSKFTFIMNEDKSIDFGLSYLSPSMHSCTIMGNAYEADNGWLYENEEANCKLTINMGSNMVNISPDAEMTCAQFCGARASFEDMVLPVSEMKRMNLTPALLAEDITQNRPCE